MNNLSVVEYKPDEREIAIFKKSFAPRATADEWQLFLYTCEAYGLSPLKKQIYMVTRWDNATNSNKTMPQISIDGLRLLAQRTGDYQGQVGPFWCGDDGQWVDVWLKREMPRAARVGVWRKDFREPLFKVVLFDAVVGTKKGGEPNHFWQKMGPHMLSKCAEAAALRAAFPEVDGLYIHEEMNQADEEASMITVVPETANDTEAPDILAAKEVSRKEVVEGMITPAQTRSIKNLCKFLGKQEPEGMDDYTVDKAIACIIALDKERKEKLAKAS